MKTDKWKADCRDARLTQKPDDDDDKKEANREGMAFQRAAVKLDQTFHAIGMHGDYVWLTSANTRRRGVTPKPPHSATTSTDVDDVDPVESADGPFPQKPQGHKSL